jgi:putative tryptophan/tyrosine transport system substrate-binding protein
VVSFVLALVIEGAGHMTIDLSRRKVIAALGGAAAIWPLAARAQQSDMPVIGYLSSQSPETVGHLTEAFRESLKVGGFVEGQTVAIEYRWANSHHDRLPTLAADLVSRKVAVIVAVGSPISAVSAKSATATIPIVFDTNDDPVKLGLVATFNQPGGNATGVSFFTSSLDAKRLELLRDLLGSKMAAIGVLVDPANPNKTSVLAEIEKAATSLGLTYRVLEADTQPALDMAFASFTHWHVDAILVTTDPYFTESRDRIVALAASNAFPTIYGRREFAATGGLISYGESLPEAYRQMGIYAAKILKGDKPADLPVIQPTKFELVINLKAAKALGLAVPDKLLAVADEVIE